MFARVLVLLASAALLVDAASLRSAIADNAAAVPDLPVDHETAAKIGKLLTKSMTKKYEGSHKETAAVMKEVHAHARKLIKEQRDSGFKPTAEMRVKDNSDAEIHWGSIVTRYRPNSDCSGVPSMVVAERLKGECWPDGFGGSYSISCAHENEEGKIVTTYNSFPINEACEWDALSYSYPMTVDAKCKINNAYVSSDPALPEMVSHQCARKYLKEYAYEKGGLVVENHASDDYQCQGTAFSVAVQRFHSCQVGYEWYDYQGNPVDYQTQSEYNRFYYFSIDGCSPDGKMTTTIYSDSSCTRPLARGSAHVDFNTCDGDGSGYSQFKCYPEPQM